jgi:hypothetical protein
MRDLAAVCWALIRARLPHRERLGDRCVYCHATTGPFKLWHGGDTVCADDDACLGRGPVIPG